MNRASLLQETVAWMDTVDLALCLFIYEVCNDYQFEYLSGSDFVNFLNLKSTSRTVTLGRRVFETLRHIQIILRQAPQRRLQQRCYKRKPRFP